MKDNSSATRAGQLTLTVAVFIVSSFAGLAAAQSDLPDLKQSDPVTDYLNAIDTAEAELSAYSMELSDLYLGLGKSHFSKQEYERARRAFQRGMQIERVNFGLNSLSQTPYLMSIAETESFLGNWDESQKALENIYFINTQAYGEKDPRMLPVLDELLDWYLDTYSERPRNSGYQNLVISERLGTRMYSILEEHDDLSNPDNPQIYRKLSHLHYFIANHIKEHGEPSEAGISFNNASTVMSQDTSSHKHYQRGKLALQKVVESLELQADTTPADQANAIAELGDWYLVFGQRMSANKAYKLAYEALETSDQSEQLSESLFGQAKVIEFTALGIEKQETADVDFEISIVISESGTPNDIEILNPPEELDKKVRRTIFKDIRAKRFRPKLVEGEATTSTITFSYASKKSQG